MKTVFLCMDGFEEAEAMIPLDLLRRGGVEVVLAGVDSTAVRSAHGVTMQMDALLEEVDMKDVEMVFVPGGLGGVNNLLASDRAKEFLTEAKADDKWLTAVCAGPTVLSRMGLIDGKNAVCYPGMEALLNPAVAQPGNRFVADGKVITGEAAGSCFDLGLKMLEVLTDRATSDKVREAVHYHG